MDLALNKKRKSKTKRFGYFYDGKQTLVCPRTVHSSTVRCNLTKMKKTIIILFAIINSCVLYSQSEIRTSDTSEKNIYNWITTISKGKLFIPENQKTKEFPIGEFYRLIITTSEIYNSIYIEKGIESENGGGTKIVWKRLVNEDDLYSNFSLKGEFSDIKFIKWNTWNSFVLRMHEKNYLFNQIDKTEIKVEELNK